MPQSQPAQPQYNLSVLNLFPVYTTRAAYQQATGQQAPPFDSTQPVQTWADPAPTGQPYLVFDPAAAADGYLARLSVPPARASRVNLPGAYNYPAYVSPPTDAIQYGPLGPVGAASADQVCMQADAQQVATEIAGFFPGLLPVVRQLDTGYYRYIYGQDPRRQWAITVGAYTFVAQTLIEARNYHGIGSPGHWTWDGKGHIDWTYDPPVIAAPAGAPTLPVPVRALLPNERIVQRPPSSPFQPVTWVVERTDLPQPAALLTADQQFAEIKSGLAAIQSTLEAVRAKLDA